MGCRGGGGGQAEFTASCVGMVIEGHSHDVWFRRQC